MRVGKSFSLAYVRNVDLLRPHGLGHDRLACLLGALPAVHVGGHVGICIAISDRVRACS